jgi:5-methylcytosine-specific restriction enzyme subunit McrC
MLLVPRVGPESSRMLRRLLRDFADVRSIQRGDLVPTWHPTRINARYHTALRLAELVLRATSAEHASGSVAINGFLLNTPQLFEDFVAVSLREAILDSYGGRVVAQSRHHLDEADSVELRPDIVWRRTGEVIAVIDAKYKAEKPSGFPNADLYQLLAYCTVLGLRVGHLVYAAGNEQPARYVVRQARIEIVCHALNLSEPPTVLLAEISHLASVIAEDLPLPTRIDAIGRPVV